jgi:hypothetical protein
MELKNDPELSSLLREWQAPSLPPSLEERVLGQKQNWWQFLLRGSIRVPVPLACCLAFAMFFAGWRLVRPEPGTCSSAKIERPAPKPISTTCSVDSKC